MTNRKPGREQNIGASRKFFLMAFSALALGIMILAGVWAVEEGMFPFLLRPQPGEADPPAPVTRVPTATVSPTEVDTATVSPTPSATATVPPTATPTASPTPLPSATPTATATSSPTPVPATETPTPTLTLTVGATEPVTSSGSTGATATPMASTPPTGAPPTLLAATPPEGFASQFDNRVWVGLYGTPLGRGLGILGRYSAEETVRLAREQALAYQAILPGVQVVPFFHMVTTIADAFPGADGDYVHRVPHERIAQWIDVARTSGLFCVLDIQPGHSPVMAEVEYVAPFLQQPGVHLAIDPEFLMAEEWAVPGQRIGTMTGAQVNEVQAWLNAVAQQVGERKVLVIHQFDDRMFSGKELLIDYPYVDLLWDADGFGGPGAKKGDYIQYAGEPGWEHGGMKLFYEYDVPLMAPSEVMSLTPSPVFVVYQ